MILSLTQKLLWEQKWRDLCEHAALQNLERQLGDPLFGAGIPQLMGTDPMADPCLQARLDPGILRLTTTLALRAMLRIPETGKQGASEPYMQFIDQLCDVASLLGRSCTTLTGLFVLPGIIDADYTGQNQAMARTPSPPLSIPKGTRIAQLILCRAVVPKAVDAVRGAAGFGSTRFPEVFWAG
uniref:dUTPase-like domain-containing protein n=1 Tax=Anser cygnoides TaxID=8845 RepID=A0A8B9E861_ANSCY